MAEHLGYNEPNPNVPQSFAASAGPGLFPATHWSVVRLAGGSGESAGAALGRLCELYWQPVYVYLRRRGHAAEEAGDLTQGFFARLLEKRDISTADPNCGRFRSFLLGAV